MTTNDNTPDNTAARKLISQIRTAGVRVILNSDKVETACTTLSEHGYSIAIGEAYSKFPDKALKTILLHELHHIQRGDALIDTENPVLANIAQDAVINETLDKEVIDALNGVRYARLTREVTGVDWPEYTPGWKYIYGVLEETLKSGKQAIPGRALTMPVKCTVKEKHKKEQLHTEACLKLRQAGCINELNIRKTIKNTKAKAIPNLRKVLEAIKKSHKGKGVPSRTRTHVRPGRIDGMRGVTRRKMSRIDIALDKSGSMDINEALVDAVHRWLQNEYEATFWEFATRYRKYGEDTDIGKETFITPILTELKRSNKTDILVVISDGLFMDRHALSYNLPDCSVIWVIKRPKQSENGKIFLQLRKQDRMVILE